MAGKRINTRKIAYSGVAAALVFVATFSVRIPIPATEGYVNLGDAVINLCAYIFGPFAFLPAAIGSAMGDLIAGYAQYILPTFIIKGLMGLAAGTIMKQASERKLSLARRIIAGIAAEIIMVGGYFAFESLPFMYGVAAALASVPFNALQGAIGVLIAVPLSYVKVFDKVRI